MWLMGLLSVGTLAVLAVVAVVFVVIAAIVAPRSDPRRPGSHELLSLEDLEDDAAE